MLVTSIATQMKREVTDETGFVAVVVKVKALTWMLFVIFVMLEIDVNQKVTRNIHANLRKGSTFSSIIGMKTV